MTTENNDQSESPTADAAAVANKLASAGSMEAIQESGVLDELMSKLTAAKSNCLVKLGLSIR